MRHRTGIEYLFLRGTLKCSPKSACNSALLSYSFLLSVFFYGIFLKGVHAQNTQELNPRQAQPKKETQKKAGKISSKGSDTERSLLKELDQGLAYPNGLYSGVLSVRFQGARKPSKKYSFRLYLKNKKRLYYFFDHSSPSSRLVYKLLYFQYPQSEFILILAWDPLREILHRKEKEGRFQRVLQSGLSYWDLALLPYSSFYRLVAKTQVEGFQDKDLQELPSYKQAQNKSFPRRERAREKFPEDLTPTPQSMMGYILKVNVLSPYIRVKARIQKEKKQVARLDFYTLPGLLKKSLYPSYSSPVYDHAQKKEISLNKAATGFRSLDFERKTLSFLEIKSYDSRAPLKPGLFDPRFIKN